MTAVTVSYYSDVLCVWAYVAQARVDAVKRSFPTEVVFDYRFCSVFGDVPTKITEAWRTRDGFEGYAKHVQGVVDKFEHVTLHPDTWSRVRPASSMSPHLFLSAVLAWELREKPGSAPRIFESAMWALRRGFFQDGLDIAHFEVQEELARPFGVDAEAVRHLIADGTAFARLSGDYQKAEKLKVEGSPTFVLNDGRQKLFGNVGFRVIEANIRELLHDPHVDQASWC